MMSIHSRKVCLLVVLLLILCCQFVGCGRKEKKQEMEPLSEVELPPAVQKVLYDYKIDVHSPKLMISQTFTIENKSDEAKILCFFFMDGRCIGEMIGKGAMESGRFEMQDVVFFQDELERVTDLYQSQKSLGIVSSRDDRSLFIVQKESDLVLYIGDKGNDVPEYTPNNYQTINLLSIKKELVDD